MDAIFALVIVGLIAWFWLDSLRAREIATGTAKALCRRQDLQFLDGTVSLIRLGLARDARGRLQVRRSYHFEYTETGLERRGGELVMLATAVELVRMEDAGPSAAAGDARARAGKPTI